MVPSTLPSPDPRDRESPLSSLRLLLAPALAFFLALIAGTFIEQRALEKVRSAERESVMARIETLGARLEGTLESNLKFIYGLAGPIALEPEMDQQRFGALARELLAQPNQLRALAAARNFVVSHMYPLEGNEQAIGLDYMRTPSQRGPALRARNTGALVLAGPIQLVQGGTGLVGRVPVFLPGETGGAEHGDFWGLVAAVINVENMLAHAGFTDSDLGLRLALRGADGKGANGAVFWGDGELFDGHSMRTSISIPGGSWQLAGLPTRDAGPNSTLVWSIRAASLVLGLLLATLLFVQERHGAQRRDARRRLLKSRTRLEDAIGSLGDGFALWGKDDRLVLCNDRLREMVARGGVTLEFEAPYESMIQGLASAGMRGNGLTGQDWAESVLSGHRERAGSTELELADGRHFRLDEQPTSDGGTVCLFIDVTEQRLAEEDVRRRANFDLLTGLPNRGRFMEQLETAIKRVARSGGCMALLFIDLDRFKNVNDSLGHEIGDKLLREAARRIVSCVRDTDTVARLGGDEFTAILDGLTDAKAPARIASKIIDRLAGRFDVDGHDVYAGASIGITLCPDDSTDGSSLLRNADLAMYRAKAEGRGAYCFFTEEMTRRAQQFASLETDLRRAVNLEQLHLHYQPIVSLEDGETVGVEALLRWEHPVHGNVPPTEFIPVAEESGLIVTIGEWVLRRACAELMEVSARAGAGALRLSVNVSGRQLLAGFGRTVVATILEETGFPANRLTIGITESTLLDEDGRVLESLDGLRALGAGIAVDDFGTGYSSLSYLQRFPVTQLKIDRSFVRDMETDAGDAKLVETILAMSQALGLSAVAEGVETERQRELLAALDCTHAQGYHFGRPGPLEALWSKPRLVHSRSTR